MEKYLKAFNFYYGAASNYAENTHSYIGVAQKLFSDEVCGVVAVAMYDPDISPDNYRTLLRIAAEWQEGRYVGKQ